MFLLTMCKKNLMIGIKIIKISMVGVFFALWISIMIGVIKEII